MADHEIKNIVGAVEDAVAYPILTRDLTSSPPGGRSGVTAPGGGPSLTNVAQNTIRQVLGWRYRQGDAAGVMSALTKAFVLKDVEGHTEWEFKPQSYTVQADMGEITGAQASIYARAKNALDQSLPLLDGLTPLRPDPDVGDVEAMRAIVREELTQLVGEFGQVAGPRVQRVDSLFKLLIGFKPDYHDPALVKGHLGQLANRLGLKRGFVNTIADEQDLTNFLILVDYVNSLFQTWESQRNFFSRGKHGEPFLGTQLVLISQALASLVDQVQDAYDALDSVFVGPPERQTTILNFYGEPAPITLAELLGWVEDFATNEGRQLLQDAGKDGVVAFRSTINRLEYLLFLTVQLSRSGSHNPTRGFHTFRAQIPLGTILQGLKLVARESDKIQRHAFDDDPSMHGRALQLPLLSITSVEQAARNGQFQLMATGLGLQSGATMKLISMRPLNEGYHGHGTVVENNGRTITANFSFPKPVLVPEKFTVVVTNPDGQYAWLEDAFTIKPPPLEPPLIKTHPQHQTAKVGDDVIFSVAATGGAPLTFQWYFRGKAIPSATGETLIIPTVSKKYSGSYRVVITNAAGMVTSEVVKLTVK